MRQVDVKLDPPYSVTVGRGLIRDITVPHRRVAVIADAGIEATYGAALATALRRGGSDARLIPVPAGEPCKTVGVYHRVLNDLAAAGLTRDTAVVAVGGGAATDLAGFAAATYLRGLAFYTVPTTLLAMVDASVGGKTGINLAAGKNLVGVFHQQRAVWVDLDTLRSLPEPVFREGAAEVFKHGLLADPTLCERVLESGFGVGSHDLEDTVADAVQVKADVVSRDPTEKGERAHLNFGHTLAHALEAVTKHEMPHGEAVGYGMHFSAHLSAIEGGENLTALTRAFLTFQKPRPLPGASLDELMRFMARDKKADTDGVRFVILRAAGQPLLARVPRGSVEAAWYAFRSDLPS